MTRTRKRLVLVLSAAAAAAALTTTTVLAASDADDNIVPASTAFTATNSGSVTFTATIDNIPTTTTCTMSQISGTTPASGLGPTAINDPTFSNCTDNHGGTDHVTANHNNGSWTLTFADSTNETENPDSTEGKGTTGDGLQLGIPQKGVTVTSSALLGCTVTGAPGGATSITATYDDVNTATFSGVSIPISGTGCTTGPTSTFNGKYVSNVNISDGS